MHFLLTLPLQLLLVVVSCASPTSSAIKLSPGTAFFTFTHEFVQSGIRIVYRPDFTGSGLNASSLDSLRFCITFDPGYPNDDVTEEDFDGYMQAIVHSYSLYSSPKGNYRYIDTPGNTIIPDTWILYRVSVFLKENFYSCWRVRDSDYVDTYRFFYVPSEIRYCELDSLAPNRFTYPLSNITRCSEVLDGTAEGIVHGANKPTTITSPECSVFGCQSTATSIVVVVTSFAAIVLVVAVASILAVKRMRIRRSEFSIRYNPRRHVAADPADHVQPAPGGPDTLLPQYKDLLPIDAPPSYEESASATEQT